ncbi:MAG: Spy/CpxP family protein refolding chaperone [Prochloraceae cyanobacterium]|nr:Spy/CpxP family protein refolding chaperone [Prochloraceae cyanobacterium]
MKLKFLPVIIGITATTVLSLPLQANAQFNRQQSQEKFAELLGNLDLTQSQKARLREIKAESKADIEEVLTSSQKNSLKSALASGESQKEALMNLNLSSSQRSEIRDIMQSKRREIQSILTAEQRQQLREEMRSQRRSRW